VTPERGIISNVAKTFRVLKQAVSQIWLVAKNNNKPDDACFSASPQKRGPKVGCCLYNRDEVTEEMQIWRAMSDVLYVPMLLQSVYHIWQYTVSAIKTKILNDAPTASNQRLPNLINTCGFYMPQIVYDNNSGKMYFGSNNHEVHLDEKWIFLRR
jgi:hypothetical protein